MYDVNDTHTRKEKTIAAQLTGKDGQSFSTIDPLASQRAELLGQVVAAQFELEQSADELTRIGASASMLHDQLRLLTTLQRRIGQAGSSTLVSLRGEIASVVAQAEGVALQSRAAAASNEAVKIEALAAVAAEARATAQSFLHDFYERKIFDPYLRFASPADETAYREREEAYRKAIEAALARGTAEGVLEATQIAEAQLTDAGAHGADRSPDFAARLNTVREQRGKLERAISNTSAPKVEKPEVTTVGHSDPKLTNILAALQAAGVVGTLSTEQAGHGITVADTAAPGRIATRAG